MIICLPRIKTWTSLYTYKQKHEFNNTKYFNKIYLPSGTGCSRWIMNSILTICAYLCSYKTLKIVNARSDTSSLHELSERTDFNFSARHILYMKTGQIEVLFLKRNTIDGYKKIVFF